MAIDIQSQVIKMILFKIKVLGKFCKDKRAKIKSISAIILLFICDIL
jgi:hypothetical protein